MNKDFLKYQYNKHGIHSNLNIERYFHNICKLSKSIIEILLRLNATGITVILATHNKELVNLIQKRVILIKKGQIISNFNNIHLIIEDPKNIINLIAEIIDFCPILVSNDYIDEIIPSYREKNNKNNNLKFI